MIRVDACGHCHSTHVEVHCVGKTPAQCPWVRCLDCGWITDWKNRSVEPPGRAKAS